MPKLYVNQYSSLKSQVLECCIGDNLYEVLIKYGIPLHGAVCKGAGVCRGCQVYIAEEGMECLACRYTVEAEELHVTIQTNLAQHSILFAEESDKGSNPKNLSQVSSDSLHDSESQGYQTSQIQNDFQVKSQNSQVQNSSEPDFGIAFDIGTTTIASALVNLGTQEVLSQTGCLNRQAMFGADVVSRIQYATVSSGLRTMHQLLREDLEALIDAYLKEGYKREQIRRMTFSGNTVMLHFLLNLPVTGMSQYPFTPEQLAGKRKEQGGIEYIILPGKSAFVGADIVAGVQYLGLGTGEEYELLLDLGTNGELWLLNREQGVCTSTSCGPAFANSVAKGNVHGTTLLDQLAKAYKEGKVDTTGLLQDEYFDKGIVSEGIQITQDTVRQVQLAKAAIHTGIELAAYELKVPLESISKVYIAGGFGFYLNPETAFCLGLLPEEFRGKLQVVGNTSLLGGIQALYNPDRYLELTKVLEESQVMDLSLDKNFQEFFLHRINFPLC